MQKLDGIVIAQQIAKDRKGKCNTIIYVNARAPMSWSCDICYHKWNACLCNIRDTPSRKGTWCPKCAGIIPYTIKDCQKVAEIKGGRCLSRIYKNTQDPLEWEYAEGHIWKNNLAHVKDREQWCKKCNLGTKLTEEDILQSAIVKDSDEAKECLGCATIKKLSEFEFRQDTQKHRNYCKICIKIIKYLIEHNLYELEILSDGMKRCSVCNKIKEELLFPKSGNGFRADCKECENARCKEFHKENKEYENNYYKDYSQTVNGRFHIYVRGAKKRKIQFNLTPEQFLKMTDKVCHYCGQFSVGKNYCGIDRVNSSLGYLVENCVPCCNICNLMKMAYPVDEFLTHILKIAKHNDSDIKLKYANIPTAAAADNVKKEQQQLPQQLSFAF